MILSFISASSSSCVLLQNLNRKSITQDAVVQMGWRLEVTPTKTGKRRVYNCQGLKVSLGGVDSRKSDSPKGRTKDHTFVHCFKNGADSLIYTWKQATFFWMFRFTCPGKSEFERIWSFLFAEWSL